MQKTIKLGDLEFANDKPMALFGGMNVLESRDMAMQVAEAYAEVTSTSNCFGRRTSCMAQLSARMCSSCRSA